MMATLEFRAPSRVDAWGIYHSPNVCYATEGPMITDGAQTTANVDLSAVAANLANPLDSSGQFLAVKVVSARKVSLCNTSGEPMYGILQNKPASGAVADVGIFGLSKAIAGAVCTGGNALMVDTSGRLVPATGTTAHRVAIAIEDAASTGTIFTVFVSQANWTTAT